MDFLFLRNFSINNCKGQRGANRDWEKLGVELFEGSGVNMEQGQVNQSAF